MTLTYEQAAELQRSCTSVTRSLSPNTCPPTSPSSRTSPGRLEGQTRIRPRTIQVNPRFSVAHEETPVHTRAGV